VISVYPFTFFNEKSTPMEERTDKIILPPEILTRLTEEYDTIPSPILFSMMTNKYKSISCGVHEFTAPGCAFVPQWMLNSLNLSPGDKARFQLIRPPMGKYVKFKPLHPAFYSIDDPQAVLRSVLNNYMTLSLNMCISFSTITKVDGLPISTDVEVQIVELQPFTTVCILGAELNVDFQENPEIMPKYEKKPVKKVEVKEELSESSESSDSSEEEKSEESEEFVPFKGTGKTLGSTSTTTKKLQPGIKTKRCPNCSQMISEQNFTIHVLRCKKLYEVCMICGEKLKNDPEIIKTHRESHENIACPQCTKLIEQKNLKDHLENKCEKRLMKCPYCNLMFPYNIFHKHQSKCGEIIEECDLCGARVRQAEMIYHKENDCPFSAKKISESYGNVVKKDQIKEDSSKVDSKNKGLECPMCFLTFETEDILQSHLFDFHPELFN